MEGINCPPFLFVDPIGGLSNLGKYLERTHPTNHSGRNPSGIRDFFPILANEPGEARRADLAQAARNEENSAGGILDGNN